MKKVPDLSLTFLSIGACNTGCLHHPLRLYKDIQKKEKGSKRDTVQAK